MGRILTGFASGSYSVIVPQYTSEIAEKEIRGTLGTYFQLQVFSGILFTYVMGSYVCLYFLTQSLIKCWFIFYFLQFNVFGVSIACAIVPVVYISLLVFIPESPMFHIANGNIKMAVLSLNFFYGPHGQVDTKLYTMQKLLTKVQTNII